MLDRAMLARSARGDVMAGESIPRRGFLGGAGAASAAIAATMAGSATPSANAQGTLPAAAASPPADLILKNAQVITVDPRSSIAEAIAIAGDKILAVGSDAAMA